MRKGVSTKGPSERANHRLLALSGALGGVIGLAMALAALRNGDGGSPSEAMFRGPLPLWLAAVLALAWGLVLPVISWRWHQVVDEHERDAYRDGAVAGFYVMGVGAPVWWFLWRGGLVPAPDVVWLYGLTMLASGLTWMWRKYR